MELNTSHAPLLLVNDLVVKRRSFTLGPTSVSVFPGQSIAIVGPNGSGKTTLIEAMLGILDAESGSITVVGSKIDRRTKEHLGRVGVVDDDPNLLFDELTALEYWSLCASTRSDIASVQEAMLSRAHILADRMQLDGHSLKLIGSYSHGMKKKTQVVGALMHEPQLLVVDELRNGLDPIAARMVEDLVSEHLQRGGGLIAATHDLFWAERKADRLVVLLSGCVVGQMSPAQLAGIAGHEGSIEDGFMTLVSRDTEAGEPI